MRTWAHRAQHGFCSLLSWLSSQPQVEASPPSMRI